jgi:hypothetical protein
MFKIAHLETDREQIQHQVEQGPCRQDPRRRASIPSHQEGRYSAQVRRLRNQVARSKSFTLHICQAEKDRLVWTWKRAHHSEGGISSPQLGGILSKLFDGGGLWDWCFGSVMAIISEARPWRIVVYGLC